MYLRLPNINMYQYVKLASLWTHVYPRGNSRNAALSGQVCCRVPLLNVATSLTCEFTSRLRGLVAGVDHAAVYLRRRTGASSATTARHDRMAAAAGLVRLMSVIAARRKGFVWQGFTGRQP